MKKIHKPTYLILAENDKNVDSLETKKVYANSIDSSILDIKTIAGTNHMMINPFLGDSNFWITVTAIILPKYYLLSKEYLDYCEKVVSLQ